MKISLKWLQDYVDIAEYFAKPQDLATLLTDAGIEVEGIENLAKQFENVVVGHILEKGQHPNADRLSLCQIATGTGRVHQIVCGAQNHKKDDRVVVALPGAVLPGGFEIKLSKIRGVESGGMLCSEKELGLRAESEGILILPADAPIGKAFSEYMGFDDIILELKVTPNRADCLSHFGLAREIAALLGREAQLPLDGFIDGARDAVLNEGESSTREMLTVSVAQPDLCPRYCGRGVRGVTVGASPAWMKKRLESVGVNSVNNVVDVTNYVMLELGQPLHAFDLREIRGGTLKVELARADETFVSFDGTESKLTGDELTIRDSERAVALAGIVGGKNSGVREDTRDVFIEAAYFTPTTVRRTARKHGIETDSSYRFARGTNPDAVPLAMNRAAQLLQEYCGGQICAEPFDIYPQPFQRPTIQISLKTLCDRLGYEVDAAAFVGWMSRLGCVLTDTTPAGAAAAAGEIERAWTVRPPAFRWDLAIDMDLVEEYARLNGYAHIPESLPVLGAAPADHSPQYVFEKHLRRLFQGQGFLQAVNYAFISRKFQDSILGANEKLASFGLRVVHEPVSLRNPLNEELNVMRVSLVPGLFKNVQHNVRHGNAWGRLFELGFAHDGKRGGGADEGNSYLQEGRLGLAAWGNPEGLWNKTSPAPLIFQVKSAVENVLRGLQVARWTWSQPQEARLVPDFLHPGQCVGLTVEGKPIGFVGTLHPALQEEHKFRVETVFGEFNLDRLAQGQPRAPKARSISAFPMVDRDIALVMPKELAASEVEAVIRKSAGELLRDVRVFDVFEGGNLASGQKSVAFRLLFQDMRATLEDTQVNALRDQVIAAVSEKFPVTVR